ncbi:MAG: BREX-2 system adenine-specific DNA-methyltransferase PglX [Deltaproteobacteria bacterium]|nr:MAG: BREX-2 system adenine-specific DNA-methyltransferase PglX [Deltaproteobacteria bacterium]
MPLTTQARADLVTTLQGHVATIAEDLHTRLLEPGSGRERARALFIAEQVGEVPPSKAEAMFDVWLDLLSRRAAVLFVLKTLYVRVLEDRRLITRRIVDRTHQQLFERLAPDLGETAFVRWVFRDLAQPSGGLPELFAPQPAEVLAPDDALTRALLDTWRLRDPDTNTLVFAFEEEHFDGELLGNLYQELDPVVKDRYALLQTPDFVRAFMLDRTLGEALARAEAGEEGWAATELRVIDPACGSGHFLLDAFARLTRATQHAEPAWSRTEVARHTLGRIVGLDINDYAAALARARLVMTAMEWTGATSLAQAAELTPQVYCADGLEHIEDPDGTANVPQITLLEPVRDIPRASLTPEATRVALKPILSQGFHVVVANPPYITEKDAARKAYHREKVGRPKKPRYISAYREYSLSSPFIERCFQLARPEGHVGLITSNNFAKRSFGIKTIQNVLAKVDLRLIVDTSGAYIPGHGTPTILLFGRRAKPKPKVPVVAVLGKRGEPGVPDDPATGKVWSAILQGWDKPGFDSNFVSCEEIPRAVLKEHPWSLRGGGALGLQLRLEKKSTEEIEDISQSLGFMCITKADLVFVMEDHHAQRAGLETQDIRDFGIGADVRDWQITPSNIVVFPYDDTLEPADLKEREALASYLWRTRTYLGQRAVFGGGNFFTSERPWWLYGQMPTERLQTPLTITHAFVATHNHFVLDRGGKVFNRTAPVIKLPADATVDDHLALLGPLNSSVAAFWFKQVMFNKGYSATGAGGRTTNNPWEDFFEHDSTKLARFPLPPSRTTTLPWARALDALGHERTADDLASVLADPSWTSDADLRAALRARRSRDLDRLLRMVGLQEELDWLCYRLYGVADEALPALSPDQTPPLCPGQRPFELRLASEDAEVRDAIARGESPDGTPTAWFSRHGWEPVTALPETLPASYRALVQRRLSAIANSADLRLLEAPVHKRRWYRPDYEAQEHEALERYLLDRLEAAVRDGGRLTTAERLARDLQGEPRLEAVVHLYTGSAGADLVPLFANLLAQESVPAHPVHRYSRKGLKKRAAWEKVWELQHREDQGEKVKIPKPPKYVTGDFCAKESYKLRGPLDVPKERFVAHTEIPRPDGSARTLAQRWYGWAGWTPRLRFGTLFDLLDDLDDEGVADEQRVALYDLMYRLTDTVARTEPGVASNQRADLQAEAHGRPSPAALEAWLRDHPA